MLTKKDIDQIAALLDVKLDEKLEQKLEEKLEEKLGRLPTKEEFYQMMDKLMGELKGHREERAAMKSRFNDYGERITTLEKIHSGSQHPSV